MNFNFTKNIISIFALSFFLILAIGSEDDGSSSSAKAEPSKYVGTHKGSWEGFVLSNDVLGGPATFTVSEDNSATLKMSGDVKASHSGYVDGDTFVSTTGDGSRNSIVDMGGENFKIVLVWTGVNVDVNF